MPDALTDIYNFRLINEHLGTAGQPSEEQFAAIRQAGFDAVVNLAMPTSDNALPNEGSIVSSLGMTYVHIPVNFAAPAESDFAAFSRVLDAFSNRRVFVHCAANMRVSAFVFLYRVLRMGVAVEEARQDLEAIWEPDPVWQRFIDKRLSR
jgi:protein tyrosine phosphatase (PTP) superfamily phosphohydrolase (DUF442 family)